MSCATVWACSQRPKRSKRPASAASGWRAFGKSFAAGCESRLAASPCDFSLAWVNGRGGAADNRRFRSMVLLESSAGRCFIRMEFGVVCNSDHREDLLEVRRQAEGLNRLPGFARLHQHLDDERDPAR